MKPFSVRPASRHFGFDRGKPIDRYYIESFLKKNKKCITGHVLEIGDRAYTVKYGSSISKSDILDIVPHDAATIVGNLETGENVPKSTFDCIILTQVIHILYDIKSALTYVIEALKPGGVLLLTTAGISQFCGCDSYGDYWRFTELSLSRLLRDVNDQMEIKVESFGNVAVAKAFLDGLALHEVPEHILNYNDKNYQMLLTALVKKKK